MRRATTHGRERATSDEARAKQKVNGKQCAYSWSPSGLVSVDTSTPGSGHFIANSSTSERSCFTSWKPSLPSAGTVATRTKSLSSFEPASFCRSSESCTARCRKSATTLMSSSRMSRDVSADVPRRIPPGTCADASPETAFSAGGVSGWRGRLKEQVRTVDGDAHEIADLLDLATGEPDRAQIPEDEVVVRAASLQSVTMADERSGQSACIGDDLLSVLLELRLGGLEKRGGDAGNGLFLDT